MTIPCEGCKQPDECRVRPNGCFAESARSVSFGTVPGGTRNASKVVVDPPKPFQPVLNAQVAGEERSGGGFMPFISKDGDSMRIKEFRERRREITSARRRHHNEPNPVSQPRSN